MKRNIKRIQQGRNGFQFIVDQNVREELNPIVFFDAGILNQTGNGIRFGMHPHSGIGIITNYEGADLVHDDTGNNANVLPDGGLQWIQAGNGIWHDEEYRKKEGAANSWSLTIHQLWMQLPPELENEAPSYQNLQPNEVVKDGNVEVVAGEYNGFKSKLNSPYNMTYLDVKLAAGETFELDTPQGQSRGFVFPRTGQIGVSDSDVPTLALGILEENEGRIQIEAKEDSKFIIVLVEPQHHAIVAGGGSIHTNEVSLQKGQENIRRIGIERGYF